MEVEEGRDRGRVRVGVVAVNFEPGKLGARVISEVGVASVSPGVMAEGEERMAAEKRKRKWERALKNHLWAEFAYM